MGDKFKTEYARLNAAQKEAVDAIDGPVLVVAGPGTGKTQLLSLRVANILRKTDADAANILCLTFTNKAATNMRERLYQLTGSASRKVVVRTFHSLAAEIMNQYADYFWSGAKLSVAPDAVQLEIIQSILATLPLDNPLASTFAGAFTALNDVKEGLKLAKEAGLTPDELRAVIELNLKYIGQIEPVITNALSPTLSAKKLDALRAAINNLPKQTTENNNLLQPLNSVIQDSLALAIEEDLPTGKTAQTGKWKKRWLQIVDGQKGMFSERKRNQWWLELANIYEAYRDLLHQRGYYDYSDMLIEVLEQLQAQPDMLADLQERYQYVLIDEFQDTNAAQLRLAHLIADHYAANNRPNLMAVGDDDQSIFAFNGAELNNMLGFRRSYPDAKLIVLTENYRSTQAVLNVSKQIIEQAEDRLIKREPGLSKDLRANQPAVKSAAIKRLAYPTRQHQQAALAEQIKAAWQTGEGSIAVLARTHDSLKQLAGILLQAGVPISYEQQSNVLQHEAVKQICGLAELAVGISDGNRAAVNAGLSALLRHPMWQLSPKTLWQLAIANYSQSDWLDSLLDHADPHLRQVAEWLVWLARLSHDQPVTTLVDHIIGLASSGDFESPFRDYYLNYQKLSNSYLESLSAVEILRSLANEFAGQEATLADFVRFVELNLSTNRVIADESWFNSGERAVQLLTVYRAKGLEFDHVFIVDAIENMWRPRAGGRTSPANLRLQAYGEKDDDYVRLLYVAATRAKHSLIATSYSHDERGNQLLPTPLLEALPLSVVDQLSATKVQVLESDLRWPRLEISDERALLSDRLQKFSLSPTALINFLNVAEAGPQSFMDRHLLRLPTPRSPMGSYGSAVHAALETAQRLVNTAKLESSTVLDRFDNALKAEHLAPVDFARYQTRGHSLLEQLLSGDKLGLNRGGLAEQRLADVLLGQARLNGNLDRIDETSEQILISDYKTGKPLTNFTTKDRTKMVKAWRHRTQLLFYALLARSSGRFTASKPINTQMIYLEAEKSEQLRLRLVPQSDGLTRLERLIEAVWPHIQNLDFPDTTKYTADIDGILAFEQDLIDGFI